MSNGARRRRIPDVPASRTHTDPRKAGGTYAGPGGPRDRNSVVVDATDAVLLDTTGALLVQLGSGGVLTDDPPAFAISLAGRINKTLDRSEVLYLTDLDGAAALVAEVFALASRSGQGTAFAQAIQTALSRQAADDALRPVDPTGTAT